MQRRLQTLSAVALVAATLALQGCVVHAYRPPSVDDPHAVVKLRRTYDAVAGTGLTEHADVDTKDEDTSGRVFHQSADAAMGVTPRIDGVLVHPRPLRLDVASGFFHVEQKQVQETYTVQVPYQTTESYDCSSGYGTSRTYRTCTRMVTQYRSETRTRTVTRAVEVSDGACSAGVIFRPLAGRIYLVDYSYRGPGSCAITCVEQQILPGDGQFKSVPCTR